MNWFLAQVQTYASNARNRWIIAITKVITQSCHTNLIIELYKPIFQYPLKTILQKFVNFNKMQMHWTFIQKDLKSNNNYLFYLLQPTNFVVRFCQRNDYIHNPNYFTNWNQTNIKKASANLLNLISYWAKLEMVKMTIHLRK